MENHEPVLLIHGGAGDITSGVDQPQYRQALSQVVMAAGALLSEGTSAVEAVVEAVRLLEELPIFNAGVGAVLTHSGAIELDACVMNGADMSVGAVTCLRNIRNAVLAADIVRKNTKHILLSSQGAYDFVTRHGLPPEDPQKLMTELRRDQWIKLNQGDETALDFDDSKFGTVGAVALDRKGNLAAATSTGGMTNQLDGRIGDTPLLGLGTFAKNGNIAVSATGEGEGIMRSLLAASLSKDFERGDTLQVASQNTIGRLNALSVKAGFIAIDFKGNFVMPFNSAGMFRASFKRSGVTAEVF